MVRKDASKIKALGNIRRAHARALKATHDKLVERLNAREKYDLGLNADDLLEDPDFRYFEAAEDAWHREVKKGGACWWQGGKAWGVVKVDLDMRQNCSNASELLDRRRRAPETMIVES